MTASDHKPSFTPGPLVVRKDILEAEIDGPNGPIATVWGDDIDANAKLFRAAPDMYEALEAVFHIDAPFPEAIWQKISLALSKARGES